ncbi:hypothetical protein T459_10157 [Capsicum annuum]|uniref:F-box domain-containing protein n=1 Tax=Capsicum annuum TaxID=4072 RepID=A0A2G3A1H9_CAPAN|nr:hypothetical protein T459_10157 [Capsicum annuum]
MLQDVPDWSELPYDLLVLIGRCLNLIVDYIKFCKSWHSAATKNNFNSDLPRVPWLMLAEEEDNEGNSFRRFFSLYDGMILKKRIPKASRKRCHIIAQIPFEPQGVVEHLYILESLGSLFVISRYGVRVRPIEDDCDSFPLTLRPDERELLGDGEFTYGTTDFRVFQSKLLNFQESSPIIFILQTTVLNHTSAMKKEADVADGSIQPHYDGVSLSSFCPPIWVTPTSY